jgi:TP901 family phage tail tape measure protein
MNTIEVIIRAVDNASRPIREIAGAVDGMATRLNRAGDSLIGAGAALTAAMALPTAALAATVRAAIDFESAFAGVRKTIDTSEEGFDALRESILRMAISPDTAVSSLRGAQNELARIMEIAGQLGVPIAGLDLFTETIAMLGMTTDMSVDAAAMSLAQFATITRMSFDDFGRLGSVVVDLGNSMATTESQIVEMAQRIAGAGNIAGMTQAEIMALAASISSVGINAEAGGTAISRVLLGMTTEIANSSDKVAVFARVAGMSAEQFAESFRRTPAQAMASFISGLRRMNNAGENVVGMLEQMGFQDVRVRDTLLRLATGQDLLTGALVQANAAWAANEALTEEANRRAETTQSTLNRLGNTVYDLRIVIGDMLTPQVRLFSESLMEVIAGVRAWAVANPQAVQAIAGMVAALAVAGPALIGTGLALKAVGFALTAITGPVGLVIGAVGALGTAYATNFMGMRDVVDGAMTQIMPRLMAFANWVTQDGLPAAAAFVEREIAPRIQAGFEAIGGVWEAIRPRLEGMAAWFTDSLVPALRTSLDSHILPFVQDIVNGLGGIWAAVSPGLERMAAWFLDEAMPMIGAMIVDTIIPTFNSFIDLLRSLWNVVAPALETLLEYAVNTGFPLIARILTHSVIPVVQGLIDLLRGLWEDVRPGVEAFGNFFNGVLRGIIDSVNELLRALGLLSASPLPDPISGGGARGFGGDVPMGGRAPMVAAGGGGDTYVQVTLPAQAMISPAAAQAAGDAFGVAIAQRLRERG